MSFGKQISLFLILFFLVVETTLSQVASISGKIIDDAYGMGLPGASVVIDGTTLGAMSDMDGNFKIASVPPGTVRLKISYVGYVTILSDPFAIEAGQNKTISFNLKENINQLNETQVVGRKTTHTDNAVLMEMKQSEQIVNGVSNQQISRSQDRSATEVVKRIPGVTVTDNGFAVIRGLSERYNVTMLNGIMAPSMETDKKAFTLDVIPSSMLDRLMIYKTGAPELPGEFAGGIIKVITRNVSDDDMLSINYSTGVRANTTFQDFYQAPQGNTDWIGTDDGTRELPDAFPENLSAVTSSAELAELGKKLPNAWTAAKIKAAPDQRFSATMIRNLKLGKVKTGMVTSIQYGKTSESNSSKIFGYNVYNTDFGYSDTTYAYNDKVFKENVRLSVIQNFSFFVSPKTKIEFRNFFNQQGSNQATLRNGYSHEEGNLVKSYAYRYQERTLYSGQLQGTHDLFANRSKLEWTTGYSYSHAAEPDFRRIRTKKDVSAINDSIPYEVTLSSSASALDAGRFYSNLDEHVGTVAVDYEHSLKSASETSTPKIRAGFYTEYKDREYSARWMSYNISKIDFFDPTLLALPIEEVFAAENINDQSGFKLEEGTNASDKYTASNFLAAAYAGLSWPLSKKIMVTGGVRAEQNTQELSSGYYSFLPVEVRLSELSILPSMNASYSFTDKMLVRAAYSRTVNRPEFRELAPLSYYDFTMNSVLYGNENLVTAKIDNYDIRWEMYPTLGDMISVGVFYKSFTDAIELYNVSSSGTRNFTYGNAEQASSLGAELEIKKSFNSLVDTTGKDQGRFLTNFISRTGVLLNAALIESKVDLGDKVSGQDNKRAMTGQSPYIINAGLFYADQARKFQVTAMYNIIGRRIYAVGTQGSSDLYYLPRNSVDLTITKSLGKYLEIKAGVQDLLAENEVYQFDSDDNGKMNAKDERAMVIRKGSYYSLGFTLKL